jgi:hypothetical protein
MLDSAGSGLQLILDTLGSHTIRLLAMHQVLDRDALYYPRIHIRDPLWLKQTLLCFPQVRRMIPVEYPLSDLPEVSAFRDLTGPRGDPLLAEEDVFGYAIYQAQSRLAQKLHAQEPRELKRFTRTETEARFRGRRDEFQIHRGKLMDVLSFLEERDMAWGPAQRIRGDWVAMHPDLGKAVMSYIAIAIAEDKGLDIVTDSATTHFTVATQDEEAVFTELMRGTARRKSTENKVDELTLVVMRSCFDVSKLTPQNIADLLNDGKDLLDFKRALVPFASALPDIRDPDERERRFKHVADEVIEKWQSYRKSLPRFAVDALIKTSEIDTPKALVPLTSSLTGTLLMGVEGLLTFGIIGYTGMGVIREWRSRFNHPFRYLTRIQKAGAVLAV